MGEDLERLKQRLPLLEYLQRHNWTAHSAGTRQEFVGLCPLHRETRPSFYVNARKNLFYCHGCGRGGDLIRFVELSRNLSFRQSVLHLQRELTPVPASQLLEQTLAFYQCSYIVVPMLRTIWNSVDCVILPSSKSWASAMHPAETCVATWPPSAIRLSHCSTWFGEQSGPRCLLPADRLSVSPARTSDQPVWT